jgi:uncharacterized membrane protein (TIGR02234 family)
MAERRPGRTFGPTVLVGLGAAVLAAVAAAQDWAGASGASAGVDVTATVRGSATAPLGVALGLVALAAWGVVLVLRGRVRRVVSVVGALASAGVLATVVAASHDARRDAARAVVARGGSDAAATSLTGWFYLCAAAAALTLAAFAVAVATSPHWPAMGTRYDAPATRQGPAGAEAVTEQDMWRALDDGRDPTA